MSKTIQSGASGSSQENSQEKSRGVVRRSAEDIARDTKVYSYLLQLSGIKKGVQKLDEGDIAKKWGQLGNRTFVRRVINNLYPDLAKNESAKQDSLPALSLNKLVSILSAIESYWEDKAKSFNSLIDGQSIPEFLGDLDKLRAIRKYCELSRCEKEALNLPIDFKSYLKENFIDELASSGDAEKISINIKASKYDTKGSVQLINEDYIDELIQNIVERELPIIWKNKDKKILEIKGKVKNEIKAIELQSGLQAVKYMRSIVGENEGSLFDESFIKKWESSLPDELIENLTRFFVENVRLADEFPLHFKYIEVEKVRALPLYVKNEDEHVGLLNSELWKLDERKSKEANEEVSEFISALGGRYAYRVRVHFCLKFDSRYQTLLEKYENNLDKKLKNELHFFEEVSGASSVISLIRKALNRTVLWDLPCLKQYFPVAQEVYIAPEGKLYGNDTLATVWSASRVRLVELEDIKRLLNLEKTNTNESGASSVDFDSYVNGSDIFQGDYICFDMLEAIAVSGFYARLRTVKQIGVDPEIYLEQLCDRVVTQKNLMKGKKHLWSYPFSLKVMKSYLQDTILDKYSGKSKNAPKKNNSNEPWSNLAYEAYLCIIQGYLEEGLTKVAEEHLNELESHVKYFNNLICANYHLCKATCAFLSSEEEREHAISKCEDFLDKASKELRERSLKFFRIGEFSQANLSPSFSQWARIYALKARIAVFFPLFIQESINDLTNPIILLEKARISAARDGNSSYYAKVTLYQSWCYLMQAHIGKSREGEFNPTSCIGWAKRLIDHALLCYSDTSEKAYQDYLKDVVVYKSDDNEQDPNRRKEFGGIIVPSPPLLHPVFNMTLDSKAKGQLDDEELYFNNSNKVIDIDSSLTKIQCKSTGKIVDLFGQHSSIYFFSYGMLKLCDDYSSYSDDQIIKELKEANKFFICCWAVAEGGASVKEETNTIERNFKNLPSDDYNVSGIRGLYLHRISELVDLGKIFTVVCKYIISKSPPMSDESLDEVVRKIFGEEKGVLSKVIDDQLEYTNGQREYNSHLKRHFENIVEYLKSCESRNFDSVQNCRNNVICNIFTRLRGE